MVVGGLPGRESSRSHELPYSFVEFISFLFSLLFDYGFPMTYISINPIPFFQTPPRRELQPFLFRLSALHTVSPRKNLRTFQYVIEVLIRKNDCSSVYY